MRTFNARHFQHAAILGLTVLHGVVMQERHLQKTSAEEAEKAREKYWEALSRHKLQSQVLSLAFGEVLI